MVGGRERVGHEDRRFARGGELPHRPARTREDEVGRAESGAELVGERHELVVRAGDSILQPLELALAREVEDCGTRSAEAFDDDVVQARRSLAPAVHEQDARARRQVEHAASFRLRCRAIAGRDRAAGHAVLRSLTPLDGKREEDPLRERRREPVGETEVRVCLHQRRGNVQPGGRVDHRPRDVAPAAEDHVGLSLPQDPLAGARGSHRSA